MLRTTIPASLAAMLLLTASSVAAQEAIFPRGVTEVSDDLPASVVGITAVAGGGASAFISDEATTFTNVGGAWNVRVAFLSRFILTPELVYVGSAQSIAAPGLVGDNPTLLSNGGEANLRVNILPGLFQPYIFGGIGFRHYDIVNVDSNTSAIMDQDNVGIVPVGGGFTIRLDNFVLDARGAFRWAFDDEMLVGPDDEGLGMSTWSAELMAGVEI